MIDMERKVWVVSIAASNGWIPSRVFESYVDACYWIESNYGERYRLDSAIYEVEGDNAKSNID